MFTYRKTTRAEEETYSNKCSITLPNTMKCPRRITRVVNGNFLCEGHFQLGIANARQQNEEQIDLDAGGELLTGKSEPTEK